MGDSGGVRIQLLGGFACADADGKPIAVPSRKARGVLAYLALARDRSAPREALASTFWTSSAPAQARQSLRQCLSALRKQLTPALLSADGDIVSLATDGVLVDVEEIARALDSGHDRAVLEAACCAAGPLLENHVFGEEPADDWLRDERVRIQPLCQQLLFRCVDAHERAGALAAAEEVYWQILRLNPPCEEAHRGLMKLYASQDKRTDALSQYQACCDALARHMDAPPSATTVALFETLRTADTTGQVPPPPTGPAVPTLPLPSKPAIAVLALDNLTGDPAREYLGDGFSEDITTALSQFSSLFVIARNSAFAFKGRGLTIPEIGRQLGVHYILEGSVQAAGDRFRVTVQLVDAEFGGHAWSRKYDGDATDLFAFQDDVVQQVVATTAGRIEADAMARARRKRPEELVAHDCLLRGMYHHHLNTPEEVDRALELFRKALELEPNYPLAQGWLACSMARAVSYTMERAERINSAEYQARLADALVALERSLEIDAEDSECLRLAGEIFLFQGDRERATDYVQRAYAFNPNDDRIVAQLSALHAFAGDPEGALAYARTSMRLNPFHPGFYKFNLSRALMLLERYEEAIEPLRAATPRQNRYRAHLAACYAALGRQDAAAALVAEVLENDPSFRLAQFKSILVYADPAVNARFLALLRAAGFPE